MRNSVVLLEKLSAQGKAPRISLIGLDNFEIQSYSNSRTIPLGAKIREFFRDIIYGIKEPNISLANLARMVLRHLIVQRDLVQHWFNYDLLAAAFRLLFDSKGTHPILTTQGPGFRNDGSFNWKRPRAEKPPGKILASARRAIISGYLRYDLSRIRKLAKNGKKFFLFEMALEPANADYFAENPSPIATESRKAFLAGCREFGLTCFPAPNRLSSDPEHWQDLVHSPPTHLGAYLKRAVSTSDRVCNRDL